MPDNASELYLDPTVIKEKYNVYTSLTDRYGVDVFTDSFRTEKEKVDSELAHQTQAVLQSIFVDGITATETINIESRLFLQKKEEIINQESNISVSTFNPWYIFIFIGVGLICGIILLRYNRHKRKVREQYVADIKLDYLTE